MDIIKVLIEKLRLRELFGALFIAGLFITFLPENMASTMHIIQFRTKYQSWISAIVILIGAFYIYWIVEHIYKLIKRKLSGEVRRGKYYMKHYMTEDEKSLLVETFYDKEKNRFRSSGYIDISDGRIAALQSKNVIYRSASVSTDFTSFAFNLQPYALELLNRSVNNGSIVIENGIRKFRM